MKILSEGFTLVEVLIASAVALIIGLFLMSILVNNNGIFYKQNAIVNEGLGLNDAMNEINKNILQAVNVAVSYPQDSPIYISGSHTIILKLPALGVDGIINNIYDYVVIIKDSDKNNILRKKVFPDPASTRKSEDLVLTTILDSINFGYLNRSGVIVNPELATSVSTALSVKSSSGSISSARTSTMITTLKNAL